MKNQNQEDQGTSNHTTADLRRMLFDQAKRLEDPNCDLKKELEKAKALAGIGTVIVNSVKIETDFLRVTGAQKSHGQKQIADVKKKR